MHYLLGRYLNAKHKHEAKEWCACPNCETAVMKKSQNHVFCGVGCKDTFWVKVKGITYQARSYGRTKGPIYPGGYEQWNKDLEVEEGHIAADILLGEVDD